MEGWIAHKKFLEKRFIQRFKDKLKSLCNYVCGSLNNYTPNYSYWQEQYDFVVQLNHVIRWRERNGLLPIGRLNEKNVNDKLLILDEHE